MSNKREREKEIMQSKNTTKDKTKIFLPIAKTQIKNG